MSDYLPEDYAPFPTLEDAFVWLWTLPPHYDVRVQRTNRTGEESTGRNIHGQKTSRVGDWECRLEDATPYSPEFDAADCIATGDGDTPLDAISAARWFYEHERVGK